MRRGIALRYDVGSALLPAEAVAAAALRQAKLRRLPHIFSKVLELPLAADADVSVHEGPQDFRFVAAAAGINGSGVRAHAVRIHPGVTKVVVRDGAASWDELDLDRWRFRLPPSVNPASATAEYRNGELVVTIPKGADSVESNAESRRDVDGEEEYGRRGCVGLRLLVQWRQRYQLLWQQRLCAVAANVSRILQDSSTRGCLISQLFRL